MDAESRVELANRLPPGGYIVLRTCHLVNAAVTRVHVQQDDGGVVGDAVADLEERVKRGRRHVRLRPALSRLHLLLVLQPPGERQSRIDYVYFERHLAIVAMDSARNQSTNSRIGEETGVLKYNTVFTVTSVLISFNR